MGDLDRASMVAKNVAINNRLDQVSETLAGYSRDLTAHKAELNRLDMLQKLMTATVDEQRRWATDTAFIIHRMQQRLDWLEQPWYRRWFRRGLWTRSDLG